MKRPFVKYSGCGNDFVLIDDRDGSFPLEKAGLIQKICHRKEGIGADGVLLVQTSVHADVSMRIFNADGSEAEMCGNGLRCLAAWLLQNEVKPGQKMYSIQVGEVFYQAKEKEGEIGIRMPKPKIPPVIQELEWNGNVYTCHWMDSGVPHAVAMVENLDALPLHEVGPFVRWHPAWGKRGANATFAKRLGPSRWKMRTFERGVEAETQACGTGGMAVACLVEQLFEEASPISVEMASSETLLFSRCEDFYWMQGPVRRVFEGTIVL